MQKTFLPSASQFWETLREIWRRSYHAETTAEHHKGQPTLLGHLLITTGLLTTNLVVFALLSVFAENKAQEWLAGTSTMQVPEQTMIEAPLLRERLTEQFGEIRTRRDRHAKVMVYFYKQYFLSLSMASGSALIAILLAFFISRDGWEKTNNGLINAFFVSFSAAILYTQIPGLFQQEKNLKANRELYLAYEALGNQVLSYLATQNTIGSNPEQPNQVSPMPPEQFILQIDQQLVTLNQIPIDFDANQVIKLPDLQQMGLPQGFPMPGTPPQPPVP